mmetsp:Transcript_37204/g.115732  ORF Transcript_37204/g.115732 Transcript_37204/m.115732 type:complete len:222 (+) Transcript_37204:257-922(+)
MAPWSSPPVISSVRMYTLFAVSNVFTNVIMNGWSASFRRSHSRLTSSGILPFCFITRFRAYLICVFLCRTRRTTPAAPAPMTLMCLRSLSVTLVSCSLMRCISSCCMLPLTICEKVDFSMDQSSASLLTTSTVAVRGSSKSKARSPKYAFFPRVRTNLPSITTDTSPLAITKKDEPTSPRLMTCAPFLYRWSTKDFTSLFVCSCERCLKMCTFFTSTIFRV